MPTILWSAASGAGQLQRHVGRQRGLGRIRETLGGYISDNRRSKSP